MDRRLLRVLSASLLIAGIVAQGPRAVASAQPDGGVWSAPSSLPGGSPESISCPTRHFCMAVGGRDAFEYRDGVWHKDADIGPSGGSLYSVSCANPQFCMTVSDYTGMAVEFDDGVWGEPVLIDPIGHGGIGSLIGVSCPTPSFCMSVDGGGDAVVYRDGEWEPPQAVNGGDFSNVSCGSPTLCVAVNELHSVLQFDGSTWSRPIEVDPDGQFGRRGISCQSDTFCIVGDTDGNVVVFRHGVWQRPFSLGKGTEHGVEALSCPTSRFCLAVDDSSIGYTYHVTHWTKGTYLGNFPSPRGASCSGRHFCVAVSFQGLYEIFTRGH